MAAAPAAAGGEGFQNAGRRLMEVFEVAVDTQGFTISGVQIPVAPFRLQVDSGDTVPGVKEKITAKIKEMTGAAHATGFSPNEFKLIFDKEEVSPSGGSLTSPQALDEAPPGLTLADLRAAPYAFDIQGDSKLRMGNRLVVGNVNLGSGGDTVQIGGPLPIPGISNPCQIGGQQLSVTDIGTPGESGGQQLSVTDTGTPGESGGQQLSVPDIGNPCQMIGRPFLIDNIFIVGEGENTNSFFIH